MLHVFGGEEDWKTIYAVAAGWGKKDLQTNPNIHTYYRRWKLSDKIQSELRRIELLRDHLLQEARLQAFEDGKLAAQGETQTHTELQNNISQARRRETELAMADYTDPAQQKKKLNEIINEAKDNGEALDALKVIIQGQKNDQESARDKQVQRFYTPLRCYECPLYIEAKDKTKD